ncbi:MAG: mechanosensitive ion channel [Nanoarchaeota archaeon]|nr:mechanosensitive ion channel [Nanoarchaeota archaeon]
MNDSLLNATSKSLVYVNEIATRLVVGIIIFLVGLIIARIASKITQKILRDFSLDGTVQKKTGIKTSFEKLISGSVFFLVMMIFLVISLNYIGITNVILNILSIAVIVIVTISLLLAIKDSVPNIIAYRAIRQKGELQEGDLITIENATGTIEEISLFQVRIRKGTDIIYIPNSLFLKKEFSRKKRTAAKK